MQLDPDRCYRALRTRDVRFDGRFFTGVRTTGIYCRPICPARAPKRGNVDFYACAAAAEDAGFRPCKRCRPEASPGTPAWLGSSTTVTRALRLIGEGALDHGGVIDPFAARLGVSARHLRRLFDEHLGASPIAVAQARRVHFAKGLLETTKLPITQVAYTSGFASVRRFNTVFAETFRCAPRDVRRVDSKAGARGDRTGLELHLAYRQPYDYEALVAFLGARAIPGVETVRDGIYRRTVAFGDDAGVIEVQRDPAKNRLRLRVPLDLSRHALAIAERVRRLFDLTADSRTIEAQLGTDPMLAPVAARFPGTRVPGAWNGFEILVRAILGQQVSVKGATTLSGRIARSHGRRIETGDDDCSIVHPEPEAILRLRADRIGLPTSRAAALRACARAIAGGTVDLDGVVDLENTIEGLIGIKGIGPWTAHYVAMRACGEPDAFPSGDLVLRRAATQLAPELDSETRFVEHAERWRPWRAYAAMLLWRAYDPARGTKPDPRTQSPDRRSPAGRKPKPKRRIRA